MVETALTVDELKRLIDVLDLELDALIGRLALDSEEKVSLLMRAWREKKREERDGVVPGLYLG